MEWTLLRLFRGGWPASLVRAAGLQRSVRVLRHRVTSDRWPRGGPPLRIGFASDFHAGPTTHPTLIDEAVRALEEARPDLVLFGGDFVFLDASGARGLASRLGSIRAPLGRFAVLGNHDLWADDREITRALEAAGVRVLVNEQASLPAPFEHVSLAGLDDPWTGERDARAALAGEPAVRVVLAHAPEALYVLDGARFDLMLCGHTHGGHIALPGGVPIVSVGPLCRRYAHGRHGVGAGTLVVSRGVGATESALRWNADPDVVIVELGPR